MIKIKRQSGVALIYVLLVVAGFTVYMLNQASESRVKNQRLALEFSIAQSNGILNAAMAHHVRTGDWPRQGNRCVLPNALLYNFEGINNGWGYPITGGNSCGDSSNDYEIKQTIPRQYADSFDVAFDGEIETLNNGDFTTLTIKLDQYGGVDKRLAFDEMGEDDFNPAEFEENDCGPLDGTPDYLFGLDAMCGSEYNDPVPPVIYIGRFPFPNPNHIPGFNEYFEGFAGFRLSGEGPDDLDLYYDMFVTTLTPDPSGGPGTLKMSANLPYSQRHQETWPNSAVGDDGHNFANERCPIEGGPVIRNVMLSWCSE